MKTFGVDVSHWEGVINWSVAARWIPFVYYKCTDGTVYIDVQFAANKFGCNAAGIPHAPYHWYQPTLDPDLQAHHFVETAGEGYHRLIVDVEKGKVYPSHLHQMLITTEQLSGIKPAIYTSAGYWNEFVKPLPTWSHNYELIVANYTIKRLPLLPIGWDKFIIWQFSDSFFFPGCKEHGDANWFNGDLDAARAWFGNYRPVDQPDILHTQAKALCDDLHIRHLPSKLSKSLGHLSKGEIVDVLEIGGSDTWIKHKQGWSCVEKDCYRFMEVIK